MAPFRVPLLTTFDWQESVESILNDPPATPAIGDRYIVGTSPTGDWNLNANKIVWWDGSTWNFDTTFPEEGWFVYVKEVQGQTSGFFYRFEDSAWNIFTSAPIPETQSITNVDSPFDSTGVDILLVDTSSGNVTINLEDLTTIIGTENQREKIIYKDDYSENLIYLETFGTQRINGNERLILTGLQERLVLYPTTNGWVAGETNTTNVFFEKNINLRALEFEIM